MHQFHSTVIAALLSVVFTTMAQYPGTVRIMTYNIQADNTKHKAGDYSDIATVIKAIKPAICGLQKVDSFSIASLDVLKYLGEQTGMNYTFSMSYKSDKGSYGNGFLSDSVPKSTRRLAMPKAGTGANEDRSALEIGITMGSEKVRVIVTHLDYSGAAAQTAEVQKILPWINEGGTASDPVVIMADFNAQPTTAPMKLLTDAGFIFVKGKNGEILDTSTQQHINHILYRPAESWTLVDAGNPKYAASNRNPVWADLKLNAVDVRTPATRMNPPGNSASFSFSGNLFHYNLAAPATVSLQLYNLAGELVRTFIDNRRQSAGTHAAAISGNSLSRGIYHGILSVDGRIIAGTTALVR